MHTKLRTAPSKELVIIAVKRYKQIDKSMDRCKHIVSPHHKEPA